MPKGGHLRMSAFFYVELGRLAVLDASVLLATLFGEP